MQTSWDLFKLFNLPFKWLRFFDGFFTQAIDWDTEQQYHIEKRRLHNLSSHHHGIVTGLDVSPADEHAPFDYPHRFCLIDVFPKTLELVIRWSIQVTIKSDTVSSIILLYRE